MTGAPHTTGHATGYTAETDPLAEVRDALITWLPEQRWFSAKDRQLVSVRTLTHQWITDPQAEPAVEHAVIGATFADAGPEEHYQLLLGSRSRPGGELDYSVIGARDGRTVYDGLADGAISRLLLALITEDAAFDTLRFVPEPDVRMPIVGPGRPLLGEQSNSSVIYGERAILKLFRRAIAGRNPDLELHRALRRAGSAEVAPLLGAVEGELPGTNGSPGSDSPGSDSSGTTGSEAARPLTVAMLQEYAANSADGWSMALTSVRDLLAEADLRPDEVGGDFAGEAHRIGRTVAAVHVELAGELGRHPVDATGIVEVRLWMLARLESAAAAVPGVAAQQDAIAAVLEGVAAGENASVQRIHGDLHLGQTLRTPTGWMVIDFEGEPAKPLADRIRPDSPLRDVAGMLRSFDYAAFHQLADWEQSAASPDPQLERRAQEWADRNRSAFCDGYAELTGADPRANPALLRAYELDKAVYEVLYETRNRPSWVSIPLRSMQRLISDP